MARPRIRVELNFGSGPYAPGELVWDEGNWDVAVWAGAGAALPSLIWDHPTQGTWDNNAWAGDAMGEGFWTDLSDFAEAVSIRSGRRRALESFAATRLTVRLDNSDRRFDPTNLNGPYVVGPYSAIVPGRPVRVVAEWGGRDWPLAFVTADGWPVTWSHEVSTTTLGGTDAFKVLAGFDPLEVSPVGAGERSGARINRILDNAGWSAARDIDEGDSTLQATNLSANALSELKLTADSELGEVYVAPDGKITFRERTYRIDGDRSSTVQFTFGDGGTSTIVGTPYGEGGYGEGPYGGGTYTTVELPYADLVAAYDDETIRNRADIARVGGTVQTAIDGEAIARYTLGVPATHTRTDLVLQTDTDAANYARTIVARHAVGELRFDSMTLLPDGDDALWPVVLGLRFGDRLLIRRRPPGGGLIERECFVEGVDHDIDARGAWRTVVALSDARHTQSLVWDHPTRGMWDAYEWSF